MADKNPDTSNGSAVVTEEDLLKSIQALENKPEEEAATPAVEPEVKTASLEKSAKDAVTEGASDNLKKALDVSEALTEIVGLLGAHVDASLEGMAKSLQGAAERDLAVVKVLGDLKKSIDTLAGEVKTFGDTPTTPVTMSKQPTKEEVLTKSAGAQAQEKPTLSSEQLRKKIASSLETLAKKAEPGSHAAQEYISAAIKFESTGQLSDNLLREVQNLNKPAA